MTESLLWTKNFVQINFQISQNGSVWFEIHNLSFIHVIGKRKSNVGPNCVILADLEINFDKIFRP